MIAMLLCRPAADVAEILPTVAVDMITRLAQLNRTLTLRAQLELDAALVARAHLVVLSLQRSLLRLAIMAEQLRFGEWVGGDLGLALTAVRGVVAALSRADSVVVQADLANVRGAERLAQIRAAGAVDALGGGNGLFALLLQVGVDEVGPEDVSPGGDVPVVRVDSCWEGVFVGDHTLHDRAEAVVAECGAVDYRAVGGVLEFVAAD